MTKEEERDKLDYVRKHNSFTSPTAEDVDFREDDTYFWDCWNVDYCSKYRKAEVGKHPCLTGAKRGARCSREEKESIRAEALQKGFNFPNK